MKSLCAFSSGIKGTKVEKDSLQLPESPTQSDTSEEKYKRARHLLASMTTIFGNGHTALPTLPQDLLKKVEKALRDPNFKNSSLNHRSFSKLKDGEWLNDEVINSYIGLLRSRGKSSSGGTATLIFNTFIYTKLKGDVRSQTYSFANYKRIWERRLNVDIARMDQLLFPINKLNTHWLLCRVVTDRKSPLIEVYDSLPGKRGQAEKIAKVLSVLLNDVFAGHGVGKTWEWKEAECPVQKNWYDCGVCLCTNMEFLSRGQQPQYEGKDTGYFRKKIAIELYKEEIIPLEN